MWEQSELRAKQCVNFLIKTIDLIELGNQNTKFQQDFKNGISSAMMQNAMYLHEFNYYPGGDIIFNSNCSEVAFFISLTGNRWNMQKTEKISLKDSLNTLIQHFQKCKSVTKYAVIITDKWDDDSYEAQQTSLEIIKAKGVLIDVNLAHPDRFIRL